jgi:hypothetical protein
MGTKVSFCLVSELYILSGIKMSCIKNRANNFLNGLFCKNIIVCPAGNSCSRKKGK